MAAATWLCKFLDGEPEVDRVPKHGAGADHRNHAGKRLDTCGGNGDDDIKDERYELVGQPKAGMRGDDIGSEGEEIRLSRTRSGAVCVGFVRNKRGGGEARVAGGIGWVACDLANGLHGASAGC